MYNGGESRPVHELGLFIFRRDLRIVDNIGLTAAAAECSRLILCFIFTPEQVSAANKRKSAHAVQFMFESLQNLDKATNGAVHYFYGDNIEVLTRIFTAAPNCTYVGFNEDYTPYARKRDAAIKRLCAARSIFCKTYNDYCLFDMDAVTTGTNGTYVKFTPFYERCMQLKHLIKKPVAQVAKSKFASAHIAKNMTRREVERLHAESVATTATSTTTNDRGGMYGDIRGNRISRVSNVDGSRSSVTGTGSMISHSEGIDVMVGGRANALARHKKLDILNYAKYRDDLSRDSGTTHLSAYLKFGCISVREAWQWFAGRSVGAMMLARQLIWREFYIYLLYHYPHTQTRLMRDKYNLLKWDNNATWYKAWCAGRTGFPLVDAGMRQLAATGYMHNRARLIVACFLVKVLLVSWKRGEEWFARNLVDYDPASNCGNWGWVTGGGADSMPYFRIFNPWLQFEHDKECVYVKKWVPELRDVPTEHIRTWYDPESRRHYDHCGYPQPICDFAAQKKKALEMYAKALY